MKFFHSIRWQLQFWNSLLLALVLAGFGFTAFRLQEANLFRRIDEELERRLSPVVGETRRGLGDGPQSRPPQKRPMPPKDFRAPDHEFHLPERDLSLFDGPAGHAYYFIAWLAGGHENRSEAAPADVPRPVRINSPREARMRGSFRELYHFTPQGDCILLGRDIGDDLDALRRSAWLLAGAGGAVFMIGLVGGWGISTRALRPIGSISATAAKIADGDLSQRIPAIEAGSELGELANVLNETFSRLQASFTRQAQFTADASHELRTPLAVVLTQTQSALARERPAGEYRESLEACQRAAQRMRQLTQSLLTLARLDSGEVAKEPCDLGKIVSDTVELLRPLALEQNVTLELELAAVRCECNPEQLGQVVTNLVGNAIGYNRPGGSVQIRVAADSNAAILSVRDTGVGISQEDLPKVFERFFRADKSRTGASGHTGLGLAIAHSIIQVHGGTLGVESELGKGSTFTARLPL